MCNQFTLRQVCLMQELRKLWEQHVYWTRFFIISTAADLGDIEPVTDRLLRNPKDFAKVLRRFYGTEIAECFQELLTQHLTIAGDLVNAAKRQDAAAAAALREKWYANAREIALFLADINLCWSESKWKTMLYSHLEMTEKEANLRLGGHYAMDVEIFEEIEQEALQMADEMARGIIGQFRLC